MTGDLNKLTKLHDIHPILVKMPNGKNSVANKQGVVKFYSSITLLNVLFVPDLTCSLISIAQLVNGLICIMTFSPKLCVIQDLFLRTLIGVSKQ